MHQHTEMFIFTPIKIAGHWTQPNRLQQWNETRVVVHSHSSEKASHRTRLVDGSLRHNVNGRRQTLRNTVLGAQAAVQQTFITQSWRPVGCLLRDHFLCQMTTFSRCPHMAKGPGTLWGLLCEGTNPFQEAAPQDLVAS